MFFLRSYVRYQKFGKFFVKCGKPFSECIKCTLSTGDEYILPGQRRDDFIRGILVSVAREADRESSG